MLYAIFITVTFGMTSSSMYYYNKVMSELFLDSTSPGFAKTFRGMTTIEDFWDVRRFYVLLRFKNDNLYLDFKESGEHQQPD